MNLRELKDIVYASTFRDEISIMRGRTALMWYKILSAELISNLRKATKPPRIGRFQRLRMKISEQEFGELRNYLPLHVKTKDGRRLTPEEMLDLARATRDYEKEIKERDDWDKFREMQENI